MREYKSVWGFSKLNKYVVFLSIAAIAYFFQNCSDQKSSDNNSQGSDQQGEFTAPNSDFSRKFSFKAKDVENQSLLSYFNKGTMTLSSDGVLKIESHFYLENHEYNLLNLHSVTLRFRGKGIADSDNVERQNSYGYYVGGGRTQPCRIQTYTPDGLSELIYSSDQRPFETLPTQVFFINCFGEKARINSSIVINLSEIFSKLQAIEEGFESWTSGLTYHGKSVELVSEGKSPNSTRGEFPFSFYGAATEHAETISIPWSWHK